MQNMSEYLSRYREEMPAWLKNYKPGDFVPFSDFMSGRVGYYPGSGEDGNLVSVANRAHCLHAYLYVDYMITRDQLMSCIRWDGFRGYHPLGAVEWTEKDLAPKGQYPLDVDYPAERMRRGRGNRNENPYCFLQVFERDAATQDDWGAERFAVAFLFADGIATYHQLFCKEYKKAPFLFLLQDHGFGGNYDRFGKNGLLDAIMTKNEVYPDLVICAKNTDIWDGYEAVPDVEQTRGGMHNHERELYARQQ